MSDIRKHINIVAEATSSYELRVQDVVDKVLKKHAYYPLNGKEEILQAVKGASYGVTDYMMGGRTQKEFVSDVLAGLKGKLSKPKADPAAKKAEAQAKLQRIADKVNDVIGSTFPDGDPIDILYPWMLRNGIPDEKVMSTLDKAARLNGYKSYYKQLEDFWDQIAADGWTGSSEVTKDNNPWRVTREAADPGESPNLDVEGTVSSILDYQLHNRINSKAQLLKLIQQYGGRYTSYKTARKQFVSDVLRVLKARMSRYDWPEN